MTAILETDARDDPDELTLSPAQCRFFSEEGYLSVPSIGAEAELEALRDFFDEVFEHPERHGMRKVSRNPAGDGGLEQIHSAELKFPHLLETRFFRNARHAAAQLLGVTVEETTGYNHMLRKSAHNGAVTPWHQDEEGWALGTPARLFVHNALNCWMPLDQATVESGCM